MPITAAASLYPALVLPASREWEKRCRDTSSFYGYMAGVIDPSILHFIVSIAILAIFLISNYATSNLESILGYKNLGLPTLPTWYYNSKFFRQHCITAPFQPLRIGMSVNECCLVPVGVSHHGYEASLLFVSIPVCIFQHTDCMNGHSPRVKAVLFPPHNSHCLRIRRQVS